MIHIEQMTADNIEEIAEIEKRCFSDPWSQALFYTEINNEHANYSVLYDGEKVIGYAGFWKVCDEGHIMNIAIAPEYRGRHLSDMLMEEMINMAKSLTIRNMTLEVRISNTAALGLYEKYGFKSAGVRKGYYEDNKEDAVIMWAEI